MSGTLRWWRWGDDPGELAALVRRGGVLGIPTESSYGLGVDPTDRGAVERVFACKGRPPRQALPVVVADLEQAYELGIARDAPGLAAIAALWPAPLSIVTETARPIAAAAGEATLAIRVPDHGMLRRLLRATGPLTATSANRSGEAPILDPAALPALLETVDGAVVDDGILPGGPPSTLVRWERGAFQVLRQGRFPAASLPRP